jgi:hypothetical protein
MGSVAKRKKKTSGREPHGAWSQNELNCLQDNSSGFVLKLQK